MGFSGKRGLNVIAIILHSILCALYVFVPKEKKPRIAPCNQLVGEFVQVPFLRRRRKGINATINLKIFCTLLDANV